MNSFTFHNPTLVRRFGTLIVIGTSALLIVLAIFIANIAQSTYSEIAQQQRTIAEAQRLQDVDMDGNEKLTFYRSETPQLAQAQMQSDMQAIAQQNEVRLEVIRADQIEPANGSLRMALTLNGVVLESQLGAYLESFANHSPMIVVESVNLRRARTRNNNIDNRPLAVQLKLSGFVAQ